MKAGIISDTHGFFEPALIDFFRDCDEVWHAGDIGNSELADRLMQLKPLRAVYGNIDGTEIRKMFPQHQRFEVDGLRIWMTHIGGYPGNYAPGIREGLKAYKPGLFISGHSHILKVIPDRTFNLLHINPGAIGKNGFHLVRTAVRLSITNSKVSELEVLELPRH